MFQGCFKNKQAKKKTCTGIVKFITQFKIEFLLPFTGCGKVLGKMPSKLTVIVHHY